MRSALVCPGPSIKAVFMPGSKFRQKQDSYQRVVAVTCALLGDYPFPVFCFQEGPNKPNYISRYLHALVEKQPVVWGVKGGRDEWWDAFPDYPRRLIMDEISIADLLERFPWQPKAWLATDPAKPPLKPGSRCGCADRGRFNGNVHRHVRATCGSSMFYALARCIVDGFTEIDIYGSDMEGYWNYSPDDNSRFAWKGAEKWWDQRWEKERAAYEDIRREAAENGIKVEKVR